MSADVLWLLLDASLRSVCLAVAAGVVVCALRIRDSRAKHRIWALVTLAMLMLPVARSIDPVTLTFPLPFRIQPRVDADGAAPLRVPVQPSSTSPANEPFKVSAIVHPAASTSRVTDEFAVARSTSTSSAAAIAVGVYGSFGLVILMRILVGWLRAVRLRRACRAVAVDLLPARLQDCKHEVMEADAVQTPLVIGLWKAIIVLPTGWREWTDEERLAAIAHERSHAESRDALVGVVARLTCAVFWFHPLAWWLDRHLATLAERAADDAAVEAAGDRVRYAEVLVRVLRAVHDAGMRIGWEAVGMRGRSTIEKRIHRLLHDRDTPPVKRATMRFALIATAVAGFAFAACRISGPAATMSAADEEREVTLRNQLRDGVELPLRLGLEPEPNQLAALEAAVAADADDLKAVDGLLNAYWRLMGHGPTTIALHPVRLEKTDAGALTVARRDVILRLIATHPESPLAGQIHARIYREPIDDAFPGDPAGFTQARDAWLKLTKPAHVDSRVLEHAARFFEIDEPARAEALLLRAASEDRSRTWSVPLGLFYGRVLAGDAAPRPGNRLTRLTPPRASTGFGAVVRQKLTDTKDPVMLTATAWLLARRGSDPLHESFDPAEWAQAYYERAVQLDPTLVLPHTELISLREHAMWKANTLGPFRVSPAERYARAASLPRRERLAALIDLANDAAHELDVIGTFHDQNLTGRLELARDQARQAAQDLLTLAPAFKTDPDYGTALYTANMTLGSLAIREGNTKRAVAYLQAASEAPTSETLMYAERLVALPGSHGGPTWHLDSDLLKAGEADAVARFYDRLSETSLAMRRDLRDAAAAVRRGERPRI